MAQPQTIPALLLRDRSGRRHHRHHISLGKRPLRQGGELNSLFLKLGDNGCDRIRRVPQFRPPPHPHLCHGAPGTILQELLQLGTRLTGLGFIATKISIDPHHLCPPQIVRGRRL